MTSALLSLLLLLTGLATVDGPKEDIKQAGKEVGKEVRIARHCLPGVHYMPWIVDTF